jgi:hypothetical protein
MSAVPQLTAAASQSRLEPVDILTPAELAKRLKVPLSWVYKKSVQRGPNNMPVLRCGRYLRFDWPAVCAWLQSRDSV